MTGPRPSRTSSFASTSTTDAQNAALRGALTAFGRPPPTLREPSQAGTGPNGALAAATKVGTGNKTPSPMQGPRRSPRRSPSPTVVPSSPRGSAKGTRRSGQKDLSASDGKKMSNLGLPEPTERERPRSPSHTAAQLATARSPASQPPRTNNSTRPRAEATQKPSVAPKPRRLPEHHRHVSKDQVDKPTDSSPIQPTTTLVNLFERRSSVIGNANNKRPEPVVIKPSAGLTIESPKPVRKPDSRVNSMFQMDLEDGKAVPRPAAPSIEVENHDESSQPFSPSSNDDYVSASEDAAAPSPSNVAQKRDSRSHSVSTTASTSRDGASKLSRPSPSPLRRLSAQPMQIPSHAPKNAASPPVTTSASPQSSPSIMAQYHQLHPRRLTPLNTGDDLANAIVASSLASSRGPSPRKVEPPPPPARHQKHGKLPFSRTPSPAKPISMPHTLRKTETDESAAEDDKHPYRKHRKKRLVRKHPNKHHEGDRKRWRDAVTERERKRYEGVWAANKGLYYSFTPDEQAAFRRAPAAETTRATKAAALEQVSSIVVRDIWSRSRLPDTVLEMVWDLVDDEEVGRLSKEQFVVGMWLIDQRLKGRKLPAKVSPSVWASVRGLKGIKIKK